jgi:hypothetical protein
MKKTRVLIGLMIASLCITTVSSTRAGKGDGPQCGGGGNSNNNSNINSVIVNHHHGNGIWSMMIIPVGSIQGHAAHGDLWWLSPCPLTGPKECQ